MRVKLQGSRGMLLYEGFVTHLAEMSLPTVSEPIKISILQFIVIISKQMRSASEL